MKIATNAQNEVKNYVFSGFYGYRSTGIGGRLYEFSSPSYPISNFYVPYDAYVIHQKEDGNKKTGVAHRLKRGCTASSDRTGSLYFRNDAFIIGTCHGYGHTDTTYYYGYNFYNAFYPAGYIAPPFGENLSIFKSNQDGYSNLENGVLCNKLSITEYNELFGIVSKTASDASILSSTLPKNTYAAIYSPREACPPEVASASYYDEFQFTHILGTSTAFGGNNFNNGNPFPTSLDSFSIKVNGRYETTTVDDTTYIVYTGGRPKNAYTVDDQENKLNNTLCLANLLETRVAQGRGTNGSQLIEAPDAIQGAIGDQVSFAGADAFANWHFTFKENAETLPFLNNFTPIEGSGVRQRKSSEGTQLFLPVLSSEESFWQNRQCPDTVDFLPHTFGASIYACPSEHFDIPYYAALRRFGFYGARFLNSCKALNLQHTLSGVEYASEMPEQGSNYELAEGEIEPDSLDSNGYWSFPAYSNLLKVAKAEERYANMYALNKGFFVWANSGAIQTTAEFASLNQTNQGFITSYNALINKFNEVFQSGLSSFTGDEPNVILNWQNGLFTIVESGLYSDILLTNDEYTKFKNTISNLLTDEERAKWALLEERYTNYVSDVSGNINETFYQTISSGKEKRVRTRYFENLIRGNPVDLYPLNSIVFSFDQSKEYLESTGWMRRESSFGTNSNLPEVQRRYFEGAYGRSSPITGLTQALSALNPTSDYYFPGFFQDVKFDKTLPIPKYTPVVSGKIVDSEGRLFSPSGWLALGYNEVGGYDSNFSCFTPIFIQNPLPRVFCKLGQQPTLRSLAVDYHTLPEDKLTKRYPEVIYWASKIKLLDCNGNNLFPLRYKWYRVRKESYNETLARGAFFTSGEPATLTGEWGCLEGDGPDCTMFHPNTSFPAYQDGVARSEDDYVFLRGAVKNVDDDYYYFSTVSGRFGVRISNPTELQIEDWLRFDVSAKNGMNAVGDIKVGFEIVDYTGAKREIEFTPEIGVPNYAGYQQDVDAVPESVIEQKIPPPNAGFGDVRAFRFIGPIGYVGATRSYSPSTLKDTRGLRELWGHFLEYGQLVPFSKKLNQKEGEWLYGYKHLPTCENYQMSNGRKGVKAITYVNGKKVTHWSLSQRAVASLDMKAGIQYDRLFNQGELYPPANNLAEVTFPNMGIGHWQWGNNLGAIKRFGKFSTKKDIQFVGGHLGGALAPKTKIIQEIQERFIGPSELAGENCGYNKYGLGRNMVYYLEAFERFYLICDPVKKKNVSNKSFICPGTRLTNSAIQYFWLGNPHNTYVKRRPMYGPYAYQWRVNRHNRDRNGNGIPESFYSMGHGRPYNLLYDAPSIYGLYVKKKTGGQYLTALKRLEEAKGVMIDEGYDVDPRYIRSVWWGERGTEGTARKYGDISYSCDSSDALYNEAICNYVSAAQSLANGLNFTDHSCPQDLLALGECFDPCLSMRYAQGFFPGGKILDLFGYDDASETPNNKVKRNVRIVATTKYDSNGNIIIQDEKGVNDRNLRFRPPINTPHARITLGRRMVDNALLTDEQTSDVAGITPCQDGGSDHCNYVTPTLHLGTTTFLVGDSTVFADLKNYFANVYHSDTNIRGDAS